MKTIVKPNAPLVKARNELKELVKKQNDLYDQLGDNDPSEQQETEITELGKQIEEKSAKLEELMQREGVRMKATALLEDLEKPGHPHFEFDVEEKRNGVHYDRRIKIQKPSELFLNDPAIKEYFKQIAPDGGQIPKGTRIHTPAVHLKTLLTGASSTSAGALVDNDFRGLLDMDAYKRPLTIRDLITNGETDSDTVEFARQTTVTNAAAPVAEATATSGSSGTKPESAMAFEVVTEVVRTIAHWLPATRRALMDASQLRTLIDNFLRYGLEEELEDQIIGGNGAGENFTGLLNTTGTTAQAWDTNILTTTRKARTLVRVTGRARPTAYVLHPNDWEKIDLLQDNEGRYFFGGPMIIGAPRLWGLPVVECEAMPEGTGMVADWRLAVLWDRMAAAILASDSHADFFVRNMVAILGEMRAAFGVLRPAAFVEIDLTA